MLLLLGLTNTAVINMLCSAWAGGPSCLTTEAFCTLLGRQSICRDNDLRACSASAIRCICITVWPYKFVSCLCSITATATSFVCLLACLLPFAWRQGSSLHFVCVTASFKVLLATCVTSCRGSRTLIVLLLLLEICMRPCRGVRGLMAGRISGLSRRCTPRGRLWRSTLQDAPDLCLLRHAVSMRLAVRLRGATKRLTRGAGPALSALSAQLSWQICMGCSIFSVFKMASCTGCWDSLSSRSCAHFVTHSVLL